MDDACHGESTALQQCVHDVQRHGAEHEHEFQRLGDAGQEHGQCGGNEHGLIVCALVGIHTAVHGQCNAQQQTGSTDHLAYLEAGGGNGSQQVVVSSHVTGLLEVDEVVGPCQPQRVLTKHLTACIDTGGDGVGAAEGGVVHGDGQHVVQTEGQQQTLQRAIDKRSQNGRGLGRVGDPDAEVVDAGLDDRPEQRRHDGNDHRVGNDHHGHEALAVEESQCIRQLAEVIVFIVSHTAHKTGNDTHEHAHVQGRSTQHGGKVAVDGDLLPEQGVGHGIGVCQHGAGNAEDVAGDHVDEGKCQHRCKGTACTLLCPASADGHGEQDVQIVDDRPADVLHGGANGHDCCDVAAAAGVSPSTVSRTCKDSPSISRDTKERVRRIMAQLGYEPNFEAEPVEAFSKTIGIILPSSQRDVYENAFHLEIIRGIGQFCNQRRYVNTVITGQDDAVVLEQFCGKLGLRVPKDLSIVSFNNSLFSRITSPQLTTVDVNPYQLGMEAASQTINHIENPNLLATKIIVPHKLIQRESCCPPPEI